VNLDGDLSATSSALFTNDPTSTTNAILNFTGTGGDGINAATQTVSIASSGATRFKRITVNIGSSLLPRKLMCNLPVMTGSWVSIVLLHLQPPAQAVTLWDFGFDALGTTALKVITASSASPAATGTKLTTIAGST